MGGRPQDRDLRDYLRVALELRFILDQEITLLVAELRARGVTWEQIGESLEVTRQSAHQRFGKRLRTFLEEFEMADEVDYMLKSARRVLADPDSDTADQEEARQVIATFGDL